MLLFCVFIIDGLLDLTECMHVGVSVQLRSLDQALADWIHAFSWVTELSLTVLPQSAQVHYGAMSCHRNAAIP